MVRYGTRRLMGGQKPKGSGWSSNVPHLCCAVACSSMPERHSAWQEPTACLPAKQDKLPCQLAWVMGQHAHSGTSSSSSCAAEAR